MWILIDIIVGVVLVAQGDTVSVVIGLVAIALGLSQALGSEGPPDSDEQIKKGR